MPLPTVTTNYLVRVSARAVADGTRTVFEFNLVSAPVSITDAGLSHFDLLRPAPTGVISLVSGASASLVGYLVAVTFSTPPLAGEVDLLFDLQYTQVNVIP